MTNDVAPRSFDEYLNRLESDLLKKYGPMVHGKELIQVLGYGSDEAFRQAVRRKTVPIVVFPIEGRKGKFALSKDIAYWLTKQWFQHFKSIKAEEEV